MLVSADADTLNPPMQGFNLDLEYPEAAGGSAAAHNWLAEGFAVLTNKDPLNPDCPLVDLRITHRSRDGRIVLMLYQYKDPVTQIRRSYRAVRDCIAR